MQTPSGVGVFIWELSRCEAGNVAAIIGRARACGLSWLAVKSGDTRSSGQFTKRLADACHEAGLLIYPWWYSVPGLAETRSQIAQAVACLAAGADGVLPDCEEWWEQAIVKGPSGETLHDDKGHPRVKPADRRADGAAFAATLRAAVGEDAFIADCGAWMWPHFHPLFPDVEFGSVFNARMPEIYWTNRREPYIDVVRESEREWLALPPAARPSVIPIGSAFSATTPAAPDDVAAFLDRYPTCALWSWQHMSSEMWARLAVRAKALASPTTPADGGECPTGS